MRVLMSCGVLVGLVGCGESGWVPELGVGVAPEAGVSEVWAPPEGPVRDLVLCQPSHMVPGTTATWEISGAEPGEAVHMGMGLRKRARALCPAMLDGACLDISGAWYFGSVVADGDGVAAFDVHIPGHVTVGVTTHAQAAVVGGVSQVTTGSVVPDFGVEGACGSEDVCHTELCCEDDRDADGVCDAIDSCPDHQGELLDCDGDCVDSGWLGDGLCDPTLDCPVLEGDGGDCAVVCPDGDGDGLCDEDDRCPEHIGTSVDCFGDCVHETWLSDGHCDAELDCPRFEWDGGDCAGLGIPTEPAAAIIPEAPTAVDDLLCTVEREAVDEDTDELTYYVIWERDGALFEDATTTVWPGDTVPYDHTAPGSQFTCMLFATDGSHDSPPGVAEAQIRVPWAISVDVQNEHNCMVDDARRGHCWGHDSAGRVSGVEAELEYDTIGVADRFSCGLLHGGGMHCWGLAPDVLPDASDFVSLDGYAGVLCAQDSLGRAHCFGTGEQVGAEPAVEFQQIDVGTDYACGVGTDEQISCWGRDVAGRTLPPLGPFASLSAGHTHACGITAAGLVRCWGSNDFGKADTAHLSGTFESVAAGKSHTCAIRAGGEVTCWGRSSDGRLDAPAGVHFEELSAAQHTCGRTAEGAARCWGNNLSGEAPDVAYDPAVE
jgi:hypothetical protein